MNHVLVRASEIPSWVGRHAFKSRFFSAETAILPLTSMRLLGLRCGITFSMIAPIFWMFWTLIVSSNEEKDYYRLHKVQNLEAEVEGLLL